MKKLIKSLALKIKAAVKSLIGMIKAFLAGIGAKIKRGYQKLRAKLFGNREQG